MLWLRYEKAPWGEQEQHVNFEGKTAVLDRFFAAVEAGDVDTVGRLYAADAGIWHNIDGITQSRDENLRTLGWVCQHVANRRYEEIRRAELSDGRVFQQHVLRGTAPNGSAIEVPSCVVVTFEGELISHVEEYLDSAQVAALAL
jgi:ketosteroid isomerase-like protein